MHADYPDCGCKRASKRPTLFDWWFKPSLQKKIKILSIIDSLIYWAKFVRSLIFVNFPKSLPIWANLFWYVRYFPLWQNQDSYFVTFSVYKANPFSYVRYFLLHFKIKFTHFIWKPFHRKINSHKGVKIICVKISLFRLKNIYLFIYSFFIVDYLHS